MNEPPPDHRPLGPAGVPPAAVPPAAGAPAAYPPAAYPPAAYPPAAYPPPVPPACQPPPAYAPFPQFRSPLQWKAYVRTQFDAGQSVAKVLSEMAATGVGQQDAYRLVADVVAAMRKRALAFVVGGVVAVLVGLAVTLGTMQAARQAAESSGSGTYIMWWGPIIFGAVAAVYGLYLLGRVPSSHP